MPSPTRPPHSPDGNSLENPQQAPERGTTNLRRPIDARPDAGRPTAKKPDPHLLRAEDLEAKDVPSWLAPFVTTPTTRMTRTPDHLMHSLIHSVSPGYRQVPRPPVQKAPPPMPPAREPRFAPPPAPTVQRQNATPPVDANVQRPAQPLPPVQRLSAPLPPVRQPLAATPPAAPVNPAPQPAGAPTHAAPPPSIRKLARIIQTDWDELPPKLANEDELPAEAAAVAAAAETAPAAIAEPVPAVTGAFAEPEVAAAAKPAEPEAIVPPVMPLGAPMRASVRVSFDWPIVDTMVEPIETPVEIATPELTVYPPDERAEEEDDGPEEPVAASMSGIEPVEAAPAGATVVALPTAKAPPRRIADPDDYEFPPLELLAEPPLVEPDFELSEEFLNKNSVTLQQTLRDFGVRGEIIDANPGPVVTLYELEPAPGTKSSRVIALSADISRSMSAVSARVAVVEGRNVIGIELPNQKRETVWLRELLASPEFAAAKAKLGLCLGKTIGGEPVIADLARMPHLLVAGTTGSGKSVAINTMILSLLYQYRPEDCRLIMIDPKMLELSVYDGIPHLLTPVVTDPRKAVVALKWAVREMEERYRKMSRLGVRNIDGYNARVAEARAKGEVITRQVPTGFDKETGETVHEEEEMDLSALPYIVVIVDEMADLMMVAGKDIEGAIQRLAQMARAAGIHIVMATQRPSVDVITGTIKANFPTRISFQVTSKIDSRTILGEMGAEQLLGQGDMLYMAGGGRITRVHGPFVSDHEVEQVVAHLKTQGRPEYLDEVTSDEEEEEAAAAVPPAPDGAVFDNGSFGEEGADLYDQAIAIVMRDKKASTSYIQRRLQIGYNRAASIMERMEKEGVVGPANHAGKREILREVRDF